MLTLALVACVLVLDDGFHASKSERTPVKLVQEIEKVSVKRTIPAK